jgi:2-hydroxy-6-oxonona-2,4-dienedioate hydrolase
MNHCGHWPQFEDADTFNRIHMAFLKGGDISSFTA